ncbi:dephospho-CoA kinase [Corynebacterium casei]|uniref:Dephospho-CoA kinase n=1 Tax=Corynebacterium casei LMG S-19264 TaxID=1285583 RepID=A0ABN4CFI9_9CORY|nr:dephospho-CoA kinase [Corynebacterium casei]AHI20152.1 dephospho-CoA kinase [Corynebacterium casei LMG S-19264]MDN5800077.1 dephospho-CoA kinase [Corynebacterium casei]MDN5922028.1 dephospho-CoA kinase [Corynebacterium casei]MDN6312764.1 dephospho-CoA kinase [Corynebacterium casei]MDN6340878.1 dephospho-CoA kinase [Corynebacterium casei]
MKIIGLTGGIGSGKSTVAQLFVEEGFPLIDADVIAREVVAAGQPALQELADVFGADILEPSGELNRQLLAQRAFVDRETTDKLNAITHPRIQQRTQELFDAYREKDVEAVIYDMPLLVDNGLDRAMDWVIVVDVAAEERIRRLVEYRGLDEEDAQRRVKAQIPDGLRLAAADSVIDNNAAIDNLKPQVDQLISDAPWLA